MLEAFFARAGCNFVWGPRKTAFSIADATTRLACFSSVASSDSTLSTADLKYLLNGAKNAVQSVHSEEDRFVECILSLYHPTLRVCM